MAGNEQSTVVALDEARAVFRAEIESHHGRVVDMAGDSVLAVFETATGAVSAALDVQQHLEALAAGVPADRRMRFRIGVHLGDVIEKADGTVYGDGVNIAARLEGLALPGGVTVSDAVQGAVRHRVAAAFEDLGEQQVKNIVDPVRAYRVLAATNGGAPAKRGWLASFMPLTFVRRRWVAGAAFAFIAVLLGVAAWLLRAVPEGGATPITMSLAIGSIATPANDSATAQAAAAVAQKLSTGIGAVERNVRVVTLDRQANATATLRDAARAAGARYVVEGDLQIASSRQQLSPRLIEIGRGTLAWSARFDLPEATGSVEAEIANRNLVGQLARAVRGAEISRVAAKPMRQLDAMERVVRTWALHDQMQSMPFANEGRKLLDDALRLEPTLVPALIMVVNQLDMLNDVDPNPDHDKYVRETDEYSVRAVTLDPGNPQAWSARAVALLLLGRWNAALEASEREIKLDPYGASPYIKRAWLLTMMGRPAAALPLTENALVLNPSYAGWTLRFACEAHLLLGEADKAIFTCERASGLNPNDFLPHSFLAAAYANAGDGANAQAALKAMLKTVPGYTVAQLRAKRYSDHPAYQKLAEKYWYEGLRKAGLAEE